MHFPFKARLGSSEIQILISKDMNVQEMLDALCYALQLNSFNQVVGFRDPNTGMIIPPSIVCSEPDQIIKNETYEVLTKPILSSQPFQSSLGVPGTHNSSSNQNTQLGETQASFNARVGNLQQVIGSVQGIARNGNNGAEPPTAQNNEYNSQREQQIRSTNQAQNIIREQQRAEQQSALVPPSFTPEAHTRQPSTAPAGVERERSNFSYSDSAKESIIRLIKTWNTDALLTEQLKVKLIQKVHNEDSEIMGLYRFYSSDRDLEGFKARIIHKLLGGRLGSETLSAEERPSSMTTAGFNRSAEYLSRFSRGSMGPGGGQGAHQGVFQQQYQGQRLPRIVRPPTRERSDEGVQNTQDRYLPIIINMENSNMLDEQTSSLLKTLILEENVAIFRLINGFIARAIDEQELCAKLIRLAQQMGTYMERPMSPIPKNKKQLLQFVSSLTRYHFTEKEDIEILNKLIQEENEFLLSCFDVFDSDKDHENLIDSLQRILDKSKQMGLHHQKITPSAFYQNYENGASWQHNDRMTRERQLMHNTPQPNHNLGFGQLNMGERKQSHRMMRPETSQWNERPLIPSQQASANSYNQPHGGRDSNIFGQVQPPVRAQSFAKGDGLRMSKPRSIMQQMTGGSNPVVNRRRDRSQPHHLVGVHGMQSNQFQPTPNFETTTHKVALIPNYFSSGEEENNPFPQNPANKNQRRGQGKQAGRNKYMTAAMASMGQYPRGYQPNYMQEGSNAFYHDRRYGQNPYYEMRGAGLHTGDNYQQAFEEESDMLRRHHRNAQKPPRPRQQRSYMNNFVQSDPHDEPPSASQFAPFSQSIATNNLMDEYGEEIYHPGMISQMSDHRWQMANNPGSNFFASEAERRERGGGRGNSKYGAKINKQRRPNKSKKQHRKKYSSEEDIQEYDRQRYGGFPDDDINQRANIVDYSNYRDSNSDAEQNSNTSGSGDSDSNTSSSSEASSAAKLREEERKRTKKKEMLKKANKNKREKEKKAKKQQKQIQHLDFQQIIEDEKLIRKLRIDNYAILLYLIDKNDQEVKNYFQNHLVSKYGNDEQSSLLSQLTAKTEETYQALLEKNLSNAEYNIIRGKRSLKDGEYQEIFKQLINSGVAQFDIENLLQNLKRYAGAEEMRAIREQQEIIQQQQASKEQVEQVYIDILYDSFKTGDEKERFLRSQWEAENPQLMDLLASYLEHKDMAQLRSQVGQFLLDNLGPDHFKNLKDAINGLHKKCYISAADRDLIRELSFHDDKHLLAAWDCYTLMHDEEDFADTLQVLCDVKREKRAQQRADQNVAQSSNQPQQQRFQLRGPRLEPSEDEKRQYPSNRSSGMGPEADANSLDRDDENAQQPQQNFYNGRDAYKLQKISNQNQQPPPFLEFIGSKEQNSNEDPLQNDNNNTGEVVEGDSDEQEDPDYMEDIDGIMQYQHKILRKYAMLGMIKYCAVPFFHSLVTSRDYKMICIFEVFAQNRNEDDFLENLGILNNIRLHNEEQQALQEQGEGGDREFMQQHPQDDTEKSTQQQQFVTQHEFEERQGQQLQEHAPEPQNEPAQPPPEPLDPNLEVLLEVKHKLTPEEFEFAKPLIESKQKRALAVIRSYQKNGDQDDFINSLQRLYAKSRQ